MTNRHHVCPAHCWPCQQIVLVNDNLNTRPAATRSSSGGNSLLRGLVGLRSFRKQTVTRRCSCSYALLRVRRVVAALVAPLSVTSASVLSSAAADAGRTAAAGIVAAAGCFLSGNEYQSPALKKPCSPADHAVSAGRHC